MACTDIVIKKIVKESCLKSFIELPSNLLESFGITGLVQKLKPCTCLHIIFVSTDYRKALPPDSIKLFHILIKKMK